MALPRSGAGNTLVMIDSVAGMMNAPPMPMNARVAMSCSELSDERGEQRAEAEQRQTELQRRQPAEAVTEAPGGEQQAREHERVRVDDPLELARASRRAGRTMRRDRDVQDRVVDDDDEQADAEDEQDQPAALA